MKAKEQAYLNKITPERFFETCSLLWTKEGKPVLDGMHELIQEEYNNTAIDNLIEEGYESGEITPDEDYDI